MERVCPGGVWDYPRPPRLEPEQQRLRIVFNNIPIADSNKAFRVLETSHPPGILLPSFCISFLFLYKYQHLLLSKGLHTYIYDYIYIYIYNLLLFLKDFVLCLPQEFLLQIILFFHIYGYNLISKSKMQGWS